MIISNAFDSCFFLFIIGKVVDRWIKEEFYCTSRAKCLILIGPTGTGKTTFAKSLSTEGNSKYNYFKGRWRLDSWNDNARYSIFDDIDWDKYEQLGFPSKKDLLTQNGPTNVCTTFFSILLLLFFILLPLIHFCIFAFFHISFRLQINTKRVKKSMFNNLPLYYLIQANLKVL
jgi:energy-coupling factor transporter ATP-binding protein EcfA2